MSIKKTICLHEDVFAVVERNAKVMCNGNISNYINTLIYNALKEEIDKLSKENNEVKPKRYGGIFKTAEITECDFCGRD